MSRSTTRGWPIGSSVALVALEGALRRLQGDPPRALAAVARPVRYRDGRSEEYVVMAPAARHRRRARTVHARRDGCGRPAPVRVGGVLVDRQAPRRLPALLLRPSPGRRPQRPRPLPLKPVTSTPAPSSASCTTRTPSTRATSRSRSSSSSRWCGASSPSPASTRTRSAELSCPRRRAINCCAVSRGALGCKRARRVMLAASRARFIREGRRP